MAAKSIINIDVNDEKFQDFLSKFKDYQDAVSELPEEWRGIGVSIGDAAEKAGQAASESERMGKAFSEGVEAIMALRESTDLLNVSVQRSATSQEDFNKQSLQSRNHLKSARGEAKGIASHIADATRSLLAWSSIVGVLGGAGGLWGISALASTAQNNRFGAAGINSTSGAVSAANINYQGALNNPESTLKSLSQIQNDASRKWILSAMNIRNQSSDPADLLPEAIKNARDIYNQSGGQLQAAQARGLTEVFSVEELNRFRNMSDSEIEAMAARAKADRTALQVSDDQLRKWTELNRTLDRSAISIQNTFLDALAPLAPELSRVSEGFEKVVESFMRSPVVGELLDSVAAGLNSLGSYLSTPEFKSDVANFMRGVGDMFHSVQRFTGGLEGIMDKLSWLFSDSPGNETADAIKDSTGFDPRSIGEWIGEHTPQGLKDVMNYDLSFGLIQEAKADDMTPRTADGSAVADAIPFIQPPQEAARAIQSESASVFTQAPQNPARDADIYDSEVNTGNRREYFPGGGMPGWENIHAGNDFIQQSSNIASSGFQPLPAKSNGAGESWNSTTTRKGGAPDKYDHLIEASAKNNGVDASWLKAIIQAESSWNERAISKAGAKGLGQVMPANFLPGEDPFNPRDNIEASARILKDAYNWSAKNAGGDTDEALRYYNGGRRRGSQENRDYPGRVREAYRNIYGSSAQQENTQIARAGATKENSDLTRETNQILRDLLRTVQDRAVVSVRGSVNGDNSNMNSKLLGGFG